MSTTPAQPQFAPLYIESCRIRNFRGLADCFLELEPNLTLLVGRNNAGKSRILRALGVALGLPADLDDLTVGGASEATIDVVIAPLPPTDPSDEEVFATSIGSRIGREVQVTREEPVRERLAWRTSIRRSAEGLGARSEANHLVFDTGRREWVLPAAPSNLTRDQRSLFAVELVETRRDLVEELSKRGSAIRRVLNDLEVDDETREQLETELASLGERIVAESGALAAVKKSLGDLETHIGSLGKAALSPLPPRLEELGRSVTIDLDTGSGALPVRLHGAGARSLASLQIQGVNYDRRLGRDGPATRPHPVTLVEEPEAHLHPQAELELCGLLELLPGQVIASTHSSHVVTTVEPRCVRLLRSSDSETTVVDLGPAPTGGDGHHRALRPSTHAAEMEKLKRLVERPFGELLFASAVVIGDGATERAFLPPVVRHAIGHRAHGVCVVDPGSLSSPLAHAAVKFAQLVDIPWILFSDSDGPGKSDATALVTTHANGDQSHIVWIKGDGDGDKSCGAIEHMMIGFDDNLCRKACLTVRPNLDKSKGALELLKDVKGSVGTTLARLLVEEYPDPTAWPSSLKDLLDKLEARLTPQAP